MVSMYARAVGACLIVGAAVIASASALPRAADQQAAAAVFPTSDRCLACHKGITTSTGEDVSIGFSWRASMMANSARDP
jgi:hypothetical protein